MKVSFSESVAQSAQEFSMLRARAVDVSKFDAAVEAMHREGWTCDTSTGITRNRNGIMASFPNYDWSADYDAAPHHVFFDFFRGPLMNKYSRLLRGI